jgi:hypothetical protein
MACPSIYHRLKRNRSSIRTKEGSYATHQNVRVTNVHYSMALQCYSFNISCSLSENKFPLSASLNLMLKYKLRKFSPKSKFSSIKINSLERPYSSNVSLFWREHQIFSTNDTANWIFLTRKAFVWKQTFHQ